MKATQILHDTGQSIWLDIISPRQDDFQGFNRDGSNGMPYVAHLPAGNGAISGYANSPVERTVTDKVSGEISGDVQATEIGFVAGDFEGGRTDCSITLWLKAATFLPPERVSKGSVRCTMRHNTFHFDQGEC